jgi:CDP-diacylglycerol---serine O-phosphatidyltransferase
VVLFIALLIGYPWHILSACTVAYLLSLPIGWKSYRNHERKAEAQTVPSAPTVGPSDPPSPFVSTVADTQDNRPTRLN